MKQLQKVDLRPLKDSKDPDSLRGAINVRAGRMSREGGVGHVTGDLTSCDHGVLDETDKGGNLRVGK